MDSIQLGKKIKEARIAKKMTQSDVVGTFITRNMLSQIEGGSAFPSIKTLEYLSKVLEIPMHQLMPDTGIAESSEISEQSENEAQTALELLTGGKNLIALGKFSDAVVIFERLSGNAYLRDEGRALLAKALLGQAEQFYKSKQLGQASSAAKRAAELSGEGIYANREIKTNALLLLDEISDLIADNHLIK